MPSLSLVSYPHATCFAHVYVSLLWRRDATQTELLPMLVQTSLRHRNGSASLVPTHSSAGSRYHTGWLLSASPSLHSLEMHFIVAKLIMSRLPEGRDPHATASLWLHLYPEGLPINLSCTQIPLGLFTIRSRLSALPHCLGSTIDDACFSAGMKALHRAGQIDKRDSYFLSNYK